MSTAEATRVERRVVQPNEAYPPAGLLGLQSWVGPIEPSAPSSGPGDYETVMKASRADVRATWTFTRTTRRHGPWTYTENGVAGPDGWRTLSIENEISRVHMRFERNDHGELKQMTIYKSPPHAADGSGLPVGMLVEDGRREMILGEECKWFDMMRGAMDAGLLQCKTQDGIVLKELRTSRGGGNTLEAVRLQRRAVGLTEVLPPSGVLTRRNWGLPD